MRRSVKALTTGMTRRQFMLGTTLAAIGVGAVACGAGSATNTVAPSSAGAGGTAPASAPPAATTAASMAPSAAPVSAASAAPASVAPASTASARPSATSATPATGATPAGAATGSAGAQRYTIVPESSKATYTVKETFVGRGLATAIGSTGAVTGALAIDKTNPAASSIETITVDISKLTSDSGQRDNRIRQQWLESSKYPTATFVTKRLEGLPATPYTEGQELTFTIVGDMTIRTTTKELTFDSKGKIAGDLFTGTATTTFDMTDFGFDPPEIAGFFKTENGMVLDLMIEAKRG